MKTREERRKAAKADAKRVHRSAGDTVFAGRRRDPLAKYAETFGISYVSGGMRARIMGST